VLWLRPVVRASQYLYHGFHLILRDKQLNNRTWSVIFFNRLTLKLWYMICNMKPCNITSRNSFLCKTNMQILQNTSYLRKCNVRLMTTGYWTPSNIVSDCHHVQLLMKPCNITSRTTYWSQLTAELENHTIRHLGI
jgi:hypothetical protein